MGEECSVSSLQQAVFNFKVAKVAKVAKVQRFKGSEGQSFECANLKMCQFEDLKMCKMTPELEGEYL